VIGRFAQILVNAKPIADEGEIDAHRGICLFPPVPTDIRLFSREWCSWCIDAKEYLTERGYKFTEIDVGDDRAAYEEMKELSDQTYVPTLVAGDEVLANFDTDQLEKFLREHAIVP
jgi:glutaredoxin